MTTTGNIKNGLTIPHFHHKTDLNEYLHSPENVEINQILCDWKMIEKERLDYMNYLHFQLQIVMANLDKPSNLLSHLLSLYPEDKEDDKIDMAFLLENLHMKMTILPEYMDPTIKVQMDIIIDMMDDAAYQILEEVDTETYGDGVMRNLRRMLPYANTANDPQEEIKRALGIKAGLQQNAVVYGDYPEITKTIKLIDIELRRLGSVHNVPVPVENEEPGTVQVKYEILGEQTEDAQDYSDLLNAFSKYITGINVTEFTNIIKHH